MRKTLRGRNSLGEVKLDALRFDELKQTFAVSAHVALHFAQCRQFLAFGLANVEHVNGAEADELLLWFAFVGRIVGLDVGRDFVLARPAVADHWRENENPFFPAFDEAAKRVPRANSGHIAVVGFLSGTQHHITEGETERRAERSRKEGGRA